MSLLNALSQLLGRHQLPTNRKPMQRMAPRRGGSGIDILLNRHPEDASFINGQQGYVRQNADVGHFPMQPHGRPEDAGLVHGPQGYVPLNADVGALRGRMQPHIRQFQVPLQGGLRQPGRIPLQGSDTLYGNGLQNSDPWYDL